MHTQRLLVKNAFAMNRASTVTARNTGAARPQTCQEQCRTWNDGANRKESVSREATDNPCDTKSCRQAGASAAKLCSALSIPLQADVGAAVSAGLEARQQQSRSRAEIVSSRLPSVLDLAFVWQQLLTGDAGTAAG
jgi:phage tail tape-measure protein